MRVLIVNADDFGLSPGVNQGILEAHRRGPVTSTTVLANAPHAPAAVEAAADCPGLGFGVHLTLTCGRPLVPATCALLLGERGLFRRPRGRPGEPYPRTLGRHFAALPFAALLIELGAQVEQVLAWGVPIQHVDSHHYLECEPRLARAIGLVAAGYGLAARASRPRARCILRGLGVATPDYFLGGWYGPEATWEGLTRRLARLPGGVGELACHPGVADAELRGVSSYLEGREQELALLTREELGPLLARRGVRLGHFGELGQGR